MKMQKVIVSCLVYGVVVLAYAEEKKCPSTLRPPFLSSVPKEYSNLKIGDFVEFSFRAEGEQESVSIRGKYLGYSGGLIIRGINEKGEIAYLTIFPSDIKGAIQVLEDPKVIQEISKELDNGTDNIPK
jgi:hypothetical protein